MPVTSIALHVFLDMASFPVPDPPPASMSTVSNSRMASPGLTSATEEWDFLKSLFHLSDAHTKLQSWQAMLNSREVSLQYKNLLLI